jgi:hypothetical protein
MSMKTYTIKESCPLYIMRQGSDQELTAPTSIHTLLVFQVTCIANIGEVTEIKQVQPLSKPEYPFVFQFDDLEPATRYKCTVNDEESVACTFMTDAGQCPLTMIGADRDIEYIKKCV